MISIYTNRTVLILVTLLLTACGADNGSRTPGVSVSFEAMPSPATAAVMTSGAKTIVSGANTIILTKAYVTITNIALQTDCAGSPIFSLAPIIDMLLPTAYAHTEATPTSTGEPFVIDVLATDNVAISVGQVEPLPADYCGASISLSAADADANNLPIGESVPNDMVGITLYLEGTYNGGNAFQAQTGATLPDRNMLLTPMLSLSASNKSPTVTIEFNYDTWFDGVDPAAINNTILFQNMLNSLQRG